MKYLTSSTTTLAIVIAIVLFGVASLLDQRWQKPPEAPPEIVPEMLRMADRESALPDRSAVLSCEAAETTLLATVDAAQSCEVDDDCTILDYGYPIQCLTSIAQEDVSAVRLEYRNYEESCAYRVYYDCPSEPMQRVPVCRNNRCEVELQRHDALKELTMDYINRQNDDTP